jgi:hypothetical protein
MRHVDTLHQDDQNISQPRAPLALVVLPPGEGAGTRLIVRLS